MLYILRATFTATIANGVFFVFNEAVDVREIGVFDSCFGNSNVRSARYIGQRHGSTFVHINILKCI